MESIQTEQLKGLGYSIRADAFGYRVELNRKFIWAAGVKGRPKMHW